MLADSPVPAVATSKTSDVVGHKIKTGAAAGMMVDSLFNAMATAAFFEFVIFAVFEMRYMLNIWKSRQGNLLDSRAQQRELLGLYARFYFALLCSIFISYQAQRYGTNTEVF